MKIRSIQLRNFRNHGITNVQCGGHSNVFVGENGGGKTSILEAISFLCLTKSFYAGSDSNAVQVGEQGFDVTGDVVADKGVEYRVVLSYNGAEREKTFLVNKSPLEKLSSAIGMFPVVALSPGNGAITAGAPSERRKFLDLVLAQSSKSYLEDLLEYRRVLKQRNKILLDARFSRQDCTELLEPWNESLIGRGTRISMKRLNFINEFNPYVTRVYGEVTGGAERPSIAYQSALQMDSGKTLEIERLFRVRLASSAHEEQRTASTVVGPHRDDIQLKVNDMDARQFASQGQHKTFLVALKIAEFQYMKDVCSETPVFLLDDVFSELDESRSQRLIDMTQSLGQTFITTTDKKLFEDAYPWTEDHRKFFVKRGTVLHAESPAIIN
ncbi:MAG TPA: DNA replication/repair protein RecF [Bacteroidota bacterium]|nr:DNA replication/repair protein RecF [Bacteroidota bacterium]